MWEGYEQLGGRWSTLSPAERSIVVVVHTITSLMRMLDYVALLEPDPRIRVYWTIAPDRFNAGVAQRLRQLDINDVPWEKAVTLTFDLAICTSLHQVQFLNAKKKFAAPHGCGYGKSYPSWAWPAGETPPVYGLDRESLLDGDGRPGFDAIVLPHLNDLQVLIRQTPEATRSALIGGDLALDRLLASLANRDRYRYDFGVRRRQTLVAVASTWGSESLMAKSPDLPLRLQRELPADHRVIMTLHPAAWAEHGPRQVYAYLREASERGLDLIGPGADWRPLLAAADLVVSDHTSIGAYAAAAGKPLLLSHVSAEEIAPGSLVAELARNSPQLNGQTSILACLAAARRAGPRQQQIALHRISSVLGQSAKVVRRAMYRLMKLDEPTLPPRTDPVPYAEPHRG